jgi:hypothetical protein
MSLFRPETMVAASENPPSRSTLGSPRRNFPRPPSTINLDIEETAFAVTQEVNELQSASSEEGTYDRAYNCEYNVDLISIDRKGSTQRFSSFQAMYLGNTSPNNDQFTQRLNNLLENKNSDLTVSLIKPSRNRLCDEVHRRHHYLRLPKPLPSSSNWPVRRCTQALSSEKYQLPREELDFIKEEMDVFLTHQEALLRKEEARIEQLGHEIRVSDRMNTRLWEAFFHDNNKQKLMKLHDVLNKQQLENLSSSQKQKMLNDDVADMYNNPDWVPLSRLIIGFSSKLRTLFPLTLLAGSAGQMTPDQVICNWVNAKGEYKRCLANWKQSGNGDGNYRHHHSTQTSTSTDVSGTSSVGEFTTDDRQAFVSSIHMSYYWAVVEELGLSDSICQSLTSAG